MPPFSQLVKDSAPRLVDLPVTQSHSLSDFDDSPRGETRKVREEISERWSAEIVWKLAQALLDIRKEGFNLPKAEEFRRIQEKVLPLSLRRPRGSALYWLKKIMPVFNPLYEDYLESLKSKSKVAEEIKSPQNQALASVIQQEMSTYFKELIHTLKAAFASVENQNRVLSLKLDELMQLTKDSRVPLVPNSVLLHPEDWNAKNSVLHEELKADKKPRLRKIIALVYGPVIPFTVLATLEMDKAFPNFEMQCIMSPGEDFKARVEAVDVVFYSKRVTSPSALGVMRQHREHVIGVEDSIESLKQAAQAYMEIFD